jgi:hypothetical protein
MSDNMTRPEVRAFLERFFSKPNRLKVDSKPQLPSWVGRLTGATPLPTVLPCWREGDVVDWYGLAFDDRELRALGESLTAFVGPSHTTFRGRVANLDGTDPIDQAVQTLTGGRAFKFRGQDPAAIWRSLELMRKVWARRGSRGAQTPTPVGRVLRDFYMALQATDRPAAEDVLLLLRGEYHLDGVNLLFLRVQLLAATCAWRELLGLRELPDLLRLRRPRAVTEALLCAIYRQHLARFEEEPADPAGAVAAFRGEVVSRFPGLFSTLAGMHSSEVAKTAALLAVTSEPADLDLCDAILARKDLSAADLNYIGRLRGLAVPAPPPATADPLTLAAECAARGDFDAAFRLALPAPVSPARARLLCECALELDALDARSAAVAAVNDLPEDARRAFLARRVNQRFWDNLQGTLSTVDATQSPEPPLTDWCDWLDRLDRGDGVGSARDTARRGATEWAVEEFLGHDTTIERFATQLHRNRSQVAELTLRDCLPHLVAYFRRDKAWPNPRLTAVYQALLELLVYSTQGGRVDLIVFSELLEARLTLGVAKAEYHDLLSFCAHLWSQFAASATTDWATDVLDLVAAHPCPDPEARRGFLQAVLDRTAGFNRHLSPDQRDHLRLVAGDMGAGELASSYSPPEAGTVSGADNDVFATLGAATIAVYTLSERAALRFKAVLALRAPRATVILLHDLDGSKRLQQHARQADLFVLVTASATHAATDCIQANRPLGRPLLFPAGKGTASMLAAVRVHCQGQE